MRVLLDTHTFLWFVLNDPKLSTPARQIISDRFNTILVSPASYWEIAIKVSVGKYKFTTSFEAFWAYGLQANSMRILPLELRHATVVSALPYHHKDPFDRMLIAQSLAEQIPLVSGDLSLDPYGITRIW